MVLSAAGDTEGAGPAEANLTDFALTCTVLTRTGFIGSVAPGTASMGWVLITPLVKRAGSDIDRFGGNAAFEAVISERAGRSGGSVTGSGTVDAT